VRASLAPEIAARIPEAVLDARVGHGTVASEFDRNIRVRFDGDGPRGEAPLVAETSAARTLLASPVGPAFDKLVRSIAHSSNADAARTDNLHSITLTPDVDAVKGVRALGPLIEMARTEPGTGPVTLSTTGTPAAERSAVKSYIGDIRRTTPQEVAFDAAYNAHGDIVIMPDVSRNLLAMIGAYKPQQGDELLQPAPIPSYLRAALPASYVQQADVDVRADRLRNAALTAAHERVHSDSPLSEGRPHSEATAVAEEAAAQVHGERLRGTILRATGSSIIDVARNATKLIDHSGLNWGPFSRAKLPAPDVAVEATSEQRYVDGPAALRKLIKLTGTDTRTKSGLAHMDDLLQRKQAPAIPRTLTDAIMSKHGIAQEHREPLVKLVRGSLTDPSGFAKLRKRLAELSHS
jgi:hypothetical protein